MSINLRFWINSVMLGTGLAMDAFSVSLADGLHEPYMKRSRRNLIAGTFALFQFAMPMTGWLCVHTALGLISILPPLIPWIAAGLLFWIGTKMILEGIREIKVRKNASSERSTSDEQGVLVEQGTSENGQVKDFTSENPHPGTFSAGMLILQALATSIDALSAGFTIAEYDFMSALVCCLIIGAVTFFICAVGVRIGRKAGAALSGNASVFGGLILIVIGIQTLL